MSAINYRMTCQKCGYTKLKRWNKNEFEQHMHRSAIPGINCFKCSFPRMKLERSGQTVHDGFVPGMQRSIGKVCNTQAEYNAQLKIMGLINLGYDEFPEPEKREKNYYNNEAILRKLAKAGFSGNQLEALKRGEKLANPKQVAEMSKKMDEAAKNAD